MTDFSKPENRELFRKEAARRQELLRCSRDQAEMLTAVLMWESPAAEELAVDEGAQNARNVGETK